MRSYSSRIVALLLGALLGCITDERVEDELVDAGHCSGIDDCIVLDAGCERGCQFAVNKAEEDHIKDVLDRYERRHDERYCPADCDMSPGHADCVNDSCRYEEHVGETI